jgi:hypothetical protein
MDSEDLRKEIIMPNQETYEKEKRLELRCEDGMDNDVKALGERKWESLARNRQI